MKTPSIFFRFLCCYFAAYLALPASAVAQLTLAPPGFPSSNTVRLTLTGTATNTAYVILFSGSVTNSLPGWQRVMTGTVGQVVFDLAMTTNDPAFFSASDAPNPVPTVATPTFSPGGGSYPTPTNVAVSCATDGAAIYYTTNGSTPTILENYIYNGGSVSLASTVTLKAKAFKIGYNDSAVASATYIINAGPSVNAGGQQVLVTSSTTLQGFVVDDGLTGGGTRFTNWSKLSGPGTVTFGNASLTNSSASFSADGIYVLKLTASDGQYTNDSTVTIAVNPTLAVTMTAPADGSAYTVPTNILLQATATCTSGSVTQVLFYTGSTLIGTAADSTSSGFSYEWRSVPEGTHAVRAVAVSTDVDNFSLASDPVNLTVNWPTNVGQVTLALNDLQIPAAGLPIEVNRMYDTRYGTSGSFGANWRLDWENVRCDISASLAGGWTGTQSGGINYCMVESSPHLVTVKLSESEQHYFAPQFVFTSTSASCKTSAQSPSGYNSHQIRLEFYPVGGSLGTLTAATPDGDLGMDDDLNGWSGTITPWIFDDFSFPEDLYDPDASQLIFTALDGTRLGFNGDGTLAWKGDRNGNTLYYSSSSIYHTSGRQVTLTRDGDNRITEIYDPTAINTSGSPALKYAYAANGNLTNVARLIQRSPAVYENTVYAYTNASFTNHLTSIKDPRNLVSSRFEYDSSGRLQKQFDALGRFSSYTYDLTNHRQIVSDRLTNATVQSFTDAGQIASVTDANNGVTSYTYDERGRKISETNPQGITSTFAYDANDLLIGQTNEVGAATSASHNDFGQVLIAIDARGFGTTNEYDSSGNLIFVTNALGIVSAYGYDAQGNRLAETNALGLAEETFTLSEYNSYGDLTKITDALGHETIYTYDDNGNRLTETKTRTGSGGHATETAYWNFDAANRVIEAIDPLDGTNRIIYDALGKQAQTIDKLGRTNRYFYDAPGLLTNTTFADGVTERFYYDAEGRKLQSVDRAGRTNTSTYDALGRLTRTTYADGSYTEQLYDSAGRLSRTSQGAPPPGGFNPPPGTLDTRYYYDAAGRRTAVTNALSQGTRFAYDSNGNQTNVVDVLGRTNASVYDALNRLTTIIFPDNTAENYGYDALDRKTAVTNQASLVTRFGFDALGRLVAVTNAFGSAQAMVTRYEYDEVGNLLRQIDALSHTNVFAYDALGRRAQETLPAGQSQTFRYDAVGNLIRQTNFNGVVITNIYDALNRLTNKSSINGYKTTFAFSATGQRTDMVDASGTNTYSYDSRDRLVTNATPQGTLTYGYDGFGNLASIKSLTSNGAWVNYGYDALNRLTNVSDLATSTTNTYDFDGVGNLQTVRYHNGVTNRYAYDALNRLTNLVSGTPSALLASFSYKLAPAGNRTNLAEVLNGTGRTNQWQYDPLYRLTNEVISGAAPTGATSYNYDAVGNRTNRTSTVAGITNQTPAYNSNDQLTTDAYDSNGNTRTNNGNSFFYDAENRLTNATVGGTNITIIYDGDGNRVRKIVGTTTNSYLVGTRNLTGYAQVLEEKTNSSLSRVYTYGLDLITQRDASTGMLNYFGYDGNGTTRFLIGTNAAITDTYVYEAFGTVITNTGSTLNNYRYTGEQYDPNLGFYYLRARYMNPTSGRFMTRDAHDGSIFDPPSLHKYTYAFNEPVSHTDPSGKEGLGTVLVAIAVVVVIAVIAFIGYKIYNSSAGKTIVLADALIRSSREADSLDLQYLEGGFEMIASEKLNLARDAIRDGTTTVYIVEKGSIRHGAHVKLISGKIFIPISAFKKGPDTAAFYAFGEYQHDTIGGSLGEKGAQEQIDAVIKTLKPPYSTWKFTHGGP